MMGRRLMVVLAVVGFLLLVPVGAAALAAVCEGEPALPSDGLAWPAAGGLAQGWGYDCASGRGHRGIDIDAPGGSQILASAGGVVAFVGYTPAEGGGTTIAIEHPGGLRSTYLHLSQALVGEGQSVNQEQPIGISAGPFLHFGLKTTAPRELYFNPLLYLPGAVADSGSSPTAGSTAPSAEAEPAPATPGPEPPAALPTPPPQPSADALPSPVAQTQTGDAATLPATGSPGILPDKQEQQQTQQASQPSTAVQSEGVSTVRGWQAATGVAGIMERAADPLDNRLALPTSYTVSDQSVLQPLDGRLQSDKQLVPQQPTTWPQSNVAAAQGQASTGGESWLNQRSGPMRGLINSLAAMLLLGLVALAAKATTGRARTHPAALHVSS